MLHASTRVQTVMSDPLGFAKQVVGGFRANQGFLLAGAVAYYMLLSIVPMLALILILLSQVLEPRHLLDIAGRYLELVAPGRAQAL
ncbi:MAG: ribonuclease R, partial [Thiogranum sp.]